MSIVRALGLGEVELLLDGVAESTKESLLFQLGTILMTFL